MLLVNRTAVVIIAKQPFLDWLHTVDPTSHHLNLADLNDNVDLPLPDSDTEGQAKRYARKFCKEIFEHELDGWWREPSSWPQDLSYRNFVKWFDCRYYSMVFDLAGTPLRTEEA